jgi:23S rRNA (cytidine1920-2'-O)/16S rRNA (cytidine1409-2'-O)-methyltransferase
VDPAGKACADLGASTGGFTDLLLQRGAARVYALDVGYGQLHPRLRGDPRVVVRERENVRHLTAASLGEPVDLVTADLSFISLRLVLPAVKDVLRPGGQAVLLVKPQFEVGKGEVGKGGVVRDEARRRAALEGIEAAARELGFEVLGHAESPIAGPAGNREWLLVLRRP